MSTPAILRHRRDTAANWTSNNPVIEAGQLGYETDTLKFKLGNGSTAWTSLSYASGGTGVTGPTGPTGAGWGVGLLWLVLRLHDSGSDEHDWSPSR